MQDDSKGFAQVGVKADPPTVLLDPGTPQRSELGRKQIFRAAGSGGEEGKSNCHEGSLAYASAQVSGGFKDDPRTLSVRERLYTEAERIAHVGSWAWHLPSGAIYWSDELYRILGIDTSEQSDLTAAFFAHVHPEDVARLKANMNRLAKEGVAPPTEFRVIHPVNGERIVRAVNVMVEDADDKLTRFVGTMQDVTELRHAEKRRQRDDEMLRAAEALANVGSYRWVPTTGEIIWSNQFKVIAGVPVDDPAPTFDMFLDRLHPDDRVRLEQSTAAALKTALTESMPVRFLRSDGTTRHLILEGRFLEGGELLGSVLDVTEVRRLQTELFQAQKLEALGRLAGGIAHDFNNILAVLKLGMEARMAGKSLGTELSTAVDRGAALTRQLLSFSRKNLLEPRPVDVADLLKQSVTMVDRLLGDAVTAKVQEGTEQLTVNADPTQLQHTLINLMVNARDAMPSGGTIWLSAQARRFDASPAGVNPSLSPGSYVEIEVRDEGTGIDIAVLPHIFEPFFTTKPEGQGTGLGLSSVYGTVSQSGGGLGVRSQAGAGSVFHIYLPRTEEKPPGPVAAEPSMRAGKGERILVLDDMVAIRKVLSLILQSAGFVPVLAEDLHALVADAANVAGSVQAVITDVDMPGFSGPQIAQILCRHVPNLPVLFMSGHPPPDLPDGAPFLGKPFSAQQVIAQLTTLLGRRLSYS